MTNAKVRALLAENERKIRGFVGVLRALRSSVRTPEVDELIGGVVLRVERLRGQNDILESIHGFLVGGADEKGTSRTDD